MPPRAIVLNVDRLSRRCLGCYGHEWVETPNLDRLAARGVVFDQCFASPAQEPVRRDAVANWCEPTLTSAGVRVCTIGDVEEAGEPELDDLESTPMARLIRRAECALENLSRDCLAPWLLWIESSGVGWPGVATSQFVELYADELDDDDDSAEVLAIREIEVAHAALVTQFDHLVGRLLATIERLTGDNPPLFVLAATQGLEVGETEMLRRFSNHPVELSGDGSSFRDELVHSPLLIAGFAMVGVGSRRLELVTPSDLLPTLMDWFEMVPETILPRDARSLLPLLKNLEVEWRSELFLHDSEGGVAVRTVDFYWWHTADAERLDESESPGHLFLKPEDVWEVNDVAEQYPDQALALRKKLAEWLNAQSSEPD